ncbi:MAG: hypothetical protein KJ023_00105 [Burkholderiaceae bacterium]|nr:hypothetical protein [Burkholderiaceae bacterium]
MPAIVDWPATAAFRSAQFSLGLQVNEALARGFYTGRVLSQRSAQADRMTCAVTLPPCTRVDAGEREGYIFNLRSQRLWMRFGLPHRSIPLGTLRGTPTVTSAAVAGAMSIAITTTAAATLRPGDFLGCGTDTLIMVGIPGATANGSGAMASCPLAMPLPVALAGGVALTWDRPLGLWEWDGDAVQIDYTAPIIQQGVVLPFRQVIQG